MIGLRSNQINKELNGQEFVHIHIIQSDINLNCNFKFQLLIQVVQYNWSYQNQMVKL